MNEALNNEDIRDLFTAILNVETMEEAYAFFEDLCTVTELETFAQRLKVAKLLMSKTVYGEIVRETGASTATISRVNRSLQYGCKGYQKILGKYEK